MTRKSSKFFRGGEGDVGTTTETSFFSRITSAVTGAYDSAKAGFSGAINSASASFSAMPQESGSMFRIGLMVLVLVIIIVAVLYKRKSGGGLAVGETVYAPEGTIVNDNNPTSKKVTADGNVILLENPDSYIASDKMTVFTNVYINNINTNITQDRNILLMPLNRTQTTPIMNKYDVVRNSNGAITEVKNIYTNLPSSNNTSEATKDNFYIHIYLSKFKNDIVVRFKKDVSTTGKDSYAEIVIENVPIQKWFSVGVVRNGNTLHTYFNGRPYKSGAIPSNTSGTTTSPGRAHPIYIGSDSKIKTVPSGADNAVLTPQTGPTFYPFDGVISSVVFSNSAKYESILENLHAYSLTPQAMGKAGAVAEAKCDTATITPSNNTTPSTQSM